ncbi:hypothetical protein, partial [Citrobacter freundii]|uniref:hypothetical protein n=1 Tax=Citrobacter freundii TaxID=546 RepID=UPI001953C48F
MSIAGGVFINKRGITMPKPVFEAGSEWIGVAFVLGLVAAFAVRAWARRRQAATGQQFPVVLAMTGLIVGLPLLAYIVSGAPVALD